MSPVDDRGVSEGASVAALVVLTVIVTASVGVGVLVADSEEENEFGAEFSFTHFADREALLVTYEEGENVSAGNVVLRGEATVTWAEVAGLDESATISPGAAIQLTENNAYGAAVTGDSSVTVRYVEGDNETELASWSGG